MITVEQFLKLSKLEQEGCHIFFDGKEVQGLFMEEGEDLSQFVLPEGCNDVRELVCSFSFADDRHDAVFSLDECQDGEWTAQKMVEVTDWK